MNFIAPVRNINMLCEVIKSGVTEVYFGLNSGLFEQFSFDNRCHSVAGKPAHCKDLDDCRSIIQMATSHGIKTMFMANASYVPADYEEAFKNHIQSVIDLGVDHLYVSSLQALLLVRSAGWKIPITLGYDFGWAHEGYRGFLTDFNMDRIMISHAVRRHEVDELIRLFPEVEFMYRANFDSGAIPGTSRLWSSPNDFTYGDGMRFKYRYKNSEGYSLGTVEFLDSGSDCSLSYLDSLAESGIKHYFFMGREAPNAAKLGMLIDVYQRWIQLGSNKCSVEKKSMISEREILFDFMWKRRFCDQKRCVFSGRSSSC